MVLAVWFNVFGDGVLFFHLGPMGRRGEEGSLEGLRRLDPLTALDLISGGEGRMEGCELALTSRVTPRVTSRAKASRDNDF